MTSSQPETFGWLFYCIYTEFTANLYPQPTESKSVFSTLTKQSG